MCNVKTNYVCIQNYWMKWNFLLLTLKQNATIFFALFTFYFLIFSTLQERYVSLFQKEKKKKRHMKKNPYKSWDLTEYTEFATWFLLLLSKSINFYSLQEYPVSKIWVSPSILNFTTKVSIFSANILTILITATIFHRCYCVIISAETKVIPKLNIALIHSHWTKQSCSEITGGTGSISYTVFSCTPILELSFGLPLYLFTIDEKS